MYLLEICLYIVIGLVVSTTQFDDGRIVGGEPADIKDIPYQLSVRTARTNQHICGASIISANWAVSAAHCFPFVDNIEVILVAGASLQSRGGSIHPVQNIINHPSYNNFPQNNDIAVLEVNKPFPLGTPGVKCISLASSPPAIGALAQTSGWGSTKERGTSADQLQRVLVPIVANKDCSKLYDKYLITEQMLCAGYDRGGKDACQGDSGGPLVVNNKLIGVVSWGDGCARPQNPGVYARIDHLYTWVRKVTGVSDC